MRESVWVFSSTIIPVQGVFLMSEPAVLTVLVAVIGSGGVSTLTAWLLKRVDARREPDPQITAMAEGLRELLFCKLEHLHASMVRRGGWCPIEGKQSAERIYKAYHALGGNGVGTSMIEDIRHAHIAPEPREEA
jgi:hypothetical protein